MIQTTVGSPPPALGEDCTHVSRTYISILLTQAMVHNSFTITSETLVTRVQEIVYLFILFDFVAPLFLAAGGRFKAQRPRQSVCACSNFCAIYYHLQPGGCTSGASAAPSRLPFALPEECRSQRCSQAQGLLRAHAALAV